MSDGVRAGRGEGGGGGEYEGCAMRGWVGEWGWGLGGSGRFIVYIFSIRQDSMLPRESAEAMTAQMPIDRSSKVP